MVTIQIVGFDYDDFKCPADKQVEEVEKRIRSKHTLIGGGIQTSAGVAMFPGDPFDENVHYVFVGGEKQQSAPQPPGK